MDASTTRKEWRSKAMVLDYLAGAEARAVVLGTEAEPQTRFARLCENVASSPVNLRADAVEAGLITQQAAEAGVQAFTSVGRTGQVWVTVRNGVVQNAGVNPLGAFR